MEKFRNFINKERIKEFFIENKRKLLILLVLLIIASALSGVYFHRHKEIIMHEKAQVVIDAGHGGDDLGATYNGRYEKDDNLRLAHKVKDILEEQGIDVALTRNKDYFVTLEDRCDFANKCEAEIFVALHRNSAPNAHGVEIWISSKNPLPDRALANDILSGLDGVGISKNRGVKSGYAQGSGDYYVNKHTDMMSCLVELGFMNSDVDNQLYDENIDAYANAIARAIIDNLNDKNQIK